jgi:2-polyprenyl-3-methyl-5-hydroxy-6-metoxy-1,4-benzoquinol methylase
MLTSKLCCHADFYQDWYLRWAEALNLEENIGTTEADKRSIHRKAWEWCAISEALQERELLRFGRNGLGFAVGTEPLASAFASKGVSVLGTDLAADQAGWTNTNEHAASLEALYHSRLVDRGSFDTNVSFEPADMRDLSTLSGRAFDFIWSSCSFEHLGSLEAGLRFVVDAMNLVRPGGVAVHTTEYNVSSNNSTLTNGGSVIYRRRDIEDLAYALRGVGCALEPVEFEAGLDRQDIEFDFPPYFLNGRKHIKMLLGPYVSTSILLIIRKGAPPPVEVGSGVWRPLG